ncbi:bifunctional nicotinamide-nucleotide adenylyltransferase/Nudix hydroxylase [Deinococcus sp.]|uniref:bifunctional nicotinamide-nucleotide adenylyltransferase/Nudix hydroxylase n=1 Tax=Deinococcus sp. TaxID=47478 RepID=UPI003CC6D7F1
MQAGDPTSVPASTPSRGRKRTFGVYIGRFEPPQLAHLAVMKEALEVVQKLIVVIGSARAARNVKNPFTADERQELIVGMLREVGIRPSRLLFVQVRDYFYNENLWLSEVQRGVAAYTRGSSDVALIGHLKDDSSYYLRSFPAWEFLPTHVVSPLSATQVRRAYFEGDVGAVSEMVPPAVGQFLAAFQSGPDYPVLRQEHDYLKDYRAAWAGSPFPPVFVTTDAVLTRSGHVLLVRRAGQPGHGRLAMPGGFVDISEPLLTSCIGKVQEETGLTAALASHLRAREVFDYPERSLRGRTITHAFHFDLGLGQLPALRPGPSNAEALWLPLSEALSQPEAFFEDHHAIIEHFVLKG